MFSGPGHAVMSSEMKTHLSVSASCKSDIINATIIATAIKVAVPIHRSLLY